MEVQIVTEQKKCPVRSVSRTKRLTGQKMRKGRFSLPFRDGSQGIRLADKLMGSGRVAGGRRRTARLRRGKITGNLVLGHVERNELVRRIASGALHVELNRFASRLVFLLDGLVVGKHGDRVFGALGIGLAERDRDRTDVLSGLGLLNGELEIVAVTLALEFFEVVVVSR